MRIINSNELQKRTVCFICERDREGNFVDTRKDFFPVGKTAIDGRKYVCERCVKHMAEVSGFQTAEFTQALALDCEQRVEMLEAQVAESVENAAVIAEITALANKLAAFAPVVENPHVPKAEKPKAEKKAPSGSAKP